MKWYKSRVVRKNCGGHRETERRDGHGCPLVCSFGSEDLGCGTAVQGCRALGGWAEPEPQVGHHGAALSLCLLSQCTLHCPSAPHNLPFIPERRGSVKEQSPSGPGPVTLVRTADAGRGSKEAPVRGLSPRMKWWEPRLRPYG